MSSKTNRWRADQALKGLGTFAEGAYGDLDNPDCLEKAMTGMLCNLMHLAQLRLHLPGERSFNRAVDRAKEHYSVEKMERESEDSPYRFGGLRPVDKETYKENYNLLAASGIGYANDSTESINTLVLDSFVQGNLVLRAVTLGSGIIRQCDLVFFWHLKDKEETPTTEAEDE